jgi:hypothetical protein
MSTGEMLDFFLSFIHLKSGYPFCVGFFVFLFFTNERNSLHRKPGGKEKTFCVDFSFFFFFSFFGRPPFRVQQHSLANFKK